MYVMYTRKAVRYLMKMVKPSRWKFQPVDTQSVLLKASTSESDVRRSYSEYDGNKQAA